MRLRDARKLHNGDEVVVKACSTSSGRREAVTVVTAYAHPEQPDAYHVIEAMTSDGYRTLSHKEVL